MPEGDYTIELGKAAVVREGAQVTLLAWSGMVSIAEEAAKKADAGRHLRRGASTCAR